ncbi:hypothetical protein B0J11DRAFT_560157 [Dendryphion nanum]|uniref:Uncharacterized protein n=1 Tax=Dendryphion nanum TaxID=256645 RepID=A0A9P9DL18_9PLEO|nr:hypothetical protein B0J11DRAFT_560157 [Dendryphion nanum]
MPLKADLPPRPQRINVGVAQGHPLPSILGPELAAVSAPPPSYNPTSVAKAAAAAIPTAPITVENPVHSTGPIPSNGSVTAYLAENSILAQEAQSASIPDGYVKSFTNLQGSTQQIGYLTLKTLLGPNYDIGARAAFCESVKYCLGLNVYFERDPSINPASACPNPPPVTNIKCSLYGYPVAAESVTNKGQWRGPQDSQGEAFHVVIAGNNGYSKISPLPSPPSLTNFTTPSPLLPDAINAPLSNNLDTYLGMKLYNNGPYDHSFCAAACQAQTAYNHATANDVPLGTYCSFYTRTW